MKRKTQDWIIRMLDGVILTIGQAVVLDKVTKKEKRACELLKDARLLIVEEMEGVPSTPAKEEEQKVSEPKEGRVFSEQEIISVLKNLAEHYAERARVNGKAAYSALKSDDYVDYAGLSDSCTRAARWEAKRDTVLLVAERLSLELGQEGE